MRYTFAALFLLSFTSVTSVQAADDVKAFDWTGYYAGAQVGYSFGRHVEGIAGNYEERFKTDSAAIGVTGGYNWQREQFVFGVDGSIDFARLDGGYDMTGGATRMGIDWQAALRARAGVTYDQALFYVAAGGAVAHADYEFFDNGVSDETFHKTLWGVTLGAGVDYAISNNLIARAEYNFTDFKDVNIYPKNSYAGDDYFDRNKVHSVRLGLAYKF